MKAYVSWSLTADPLFDEEGEEVGEEEYVLIEKLYVPAEERGQGKGRKLLTGAIAEIRQKHPTLPVKLAALPFGEDGLEMAPLVEFYERCGFSIENCDGDAVIMVLD